MRPTSCRAAHEVEQLLLNAHLRDELEPFQDETLALIDVARMTTEQENAYLTAMLAWERAPALPIAEWFDPPLETPDVAALDDPEVSRRLNEIVHQLHGCGIVLEFTDHLSDRQLLIKLYRDVLPFPEKKLATPGWTVCWRFVDEREDAEIWLKYYATAKEREKWANETGQPLPPVTAPPYPRDLPSTR